MNMNIPDIIRKYNTGMKHVFIPCWINGHLRWMKQDRRYPLTKKEEKEFDDAGIGFLESNFLDDREMNDFHQPLRWGPPQLHVNRKGELLKASMHWSKTVPKSHYTSAGLWVDSQYEYLWRERNEDAGFEE